MWTVNHMLENNDNIPADCFEFHLKLALCLTSLHTNSIGMAQFQGTRSDRVGVGFRQEKFSITLSADNLKITVESLRDYSNKLSLKL